MAMLIDRLLRLRGVPANRFRSTMNKYFRRKTAEPPSAAHQDALHALSAPAPPPLPPLPHESSQLPKKSTSRWKKSKKNGDHSADANVDLSLPSVDDFRTSLFMPALSARFSMLREQDDPHSMLGKASDDSVLQPRRRSRMDMALAGRGLDDIAEVSSLRSSSRPPLPSLHHHSFASEDDYPSERDSVSVMTRARPAEGSVVFGGRQKIYMIPKGGASSRSLGRVVSEDDVAHSLDAGMSSFQRYRVQRTVEEVRESKDSHGFDFGLEHSEDGEQDEHLPSRSAKDLSHSPSLASSDKKRSTDSTGHSAARSSTAATSVASQPATFTSSSPVRATSEIASAATTPCTIPSPAPAPSTAPAPAPTMQPLKRQDTKTRRLYENGLDQHMHEQQSSAMNRLNSIHRQRTFSNKQPQMLLHGTKSAGNLRDRVQPPVYALPTLDSPSLTPNFGLFGALGLSSSNGTTPLASLPVTPLTPQHAGDIDDLNPLSQALEPADRGKATAMGAFNKPKQSFDEQQYVERQRQLQRSASTAAMRKDSQGALSTRSPLLETAPELPEIDAMSRKMEPSVRQHHLSSAYDVFQHAARLNTDSDAAQADSSSVPDTHRTFFGDISASEDEEDDDRQHAAPSKSPMYGSQHGKWQPAVLPVVSEHPALRAQQPMNSLAETDEEEAQSSSAQATEPSASRSLDPPTIATEDDDLESPVLGVDAPTVALNGLMHHLRQKSNVSSITQRSDAASTIETPAPAELTPRNLDIVNRRDQSTSGTESRVGSYAISNPWDLDETDASNHDDPRSSRPLVSPIGSEHLGGRFGDSSSAINRHSAVSELEAEAEATEGAQNDSHAQHTRDVSNATQEDREAFDNELAARRNAIQENIRKSRAQREIHSRGISPTRSSNANLKTFGMLRSGPSRESMDSSRVPEMPSNAPAKALQILGAGVGSASSLPQHQAGANSSDSSRPSAESGSRSSPPSIQPRSSQRAEREMRRPMFGLRTRENSATEPFPSADPSPPASVDGRSRANSATTPTGHPRSRGGPYRDGLEKGMAGGAGLTAVSVPDLSNLGPRELTPNPTPDLTQSPFEPPRARSGSRAAMTSYFDTHSLQPLYTGSRDRYHANMSTPALPTGHFSPLTSPMPRSPASAYASNMTPPLSGASTPLQSAFSAPTQTAPPSNGRAGGPLRKKTISKGDISEPTLISSTSNIDLVDLPEGASLRNGMDEPPPVPPLNPARRATKRILNLGRKESQDHSASIGSRAKTPDAFSRKSPELEMPSAMPRKRSATVSPQKTGLPSSSSRPGYSPTNGSPDRPVERPSPVPPINMDGAMF